MLFTCEKTKDSTELCAKYVFAFASQLQYKHFLKYVLTQFFWVCCMEWYVHFQFLIG